MLPALFRERLVKPAPLKAAPYLLHGKIELPQRLDERSRLELTRLIIAIARPLVDLRGNQQP